MKKVIAGGFLFLGGVIGFIGIIIAVTLHGTLGGNWLTMVGHQNLVVPFLLFVLLAVVGIVTMIFGIREKPGDSC